MVFGKPNKYFAYLPPRATINVTLATMTADELLTKKDLAEFKQELFAILQPFKDAKDLAGQKWLKNEDLKKILKVSNGTIQNLRVNGSLPFTKIGGIFYYKQEDVDLMLSGPEKKSPKLRSARRESSGSASSST
jgi:hypothetical protein